MTTRPAPRHPPGAPRAVRGRLQHRGVARALAAMGAAALVAVGVAGGAAYTGPTLAPKTPTTAVATPAVARPAGLATARLSGTDRYATAAAVSAATFALGAPVAYVATGADYPDALAAAAAAGGRGPVLLGGAGGLPPTTLLELERLHPAQVVIVGGTLALPKTTEAALHRALPGASVSRVQGPDRYTTAAFLSGATFKAHVAVAYVATGDAFPDALTAAAAASGKGPVFLVPTKGLPAATAFVLGRLAPRQVVIVGGTLAIPATMEASIGALLRGGSVQRIAGADRYATAAAVADVAYPLGASVAYLATGADFPDALTAAAAAGGRGPVLLVTAGNVPAVVMAEVHRLAPTRVVLVGGNAAIGNATVAQVVAARVPIAPIINATVTTATPKPVASTTTAARPAVATTTTKAPTKASVTSTSRPTPTTTARATTTTAPVTTTTAHVTTTTAQIVTTTSSVATTTSSTVPVPSSPPPPPKAGATTAVATAEAQVGKPYLWAGAGPAAFDCSGLTMYAWAAAGVQLPHNAAAQAALLPAVQADTAHLAPGDLLFYDTPIDHVAMYVGGGMMVEAAHSGVPVRLIPMRTSDLVGAGRP